MFDTMTDYVNRYASNQRSLEVVNSIQTDYECCGVSLWLDWARVSLGGIPGISTKMKNHFTQLLIYLYR